MTKNVTALLIVQNPVDRTLIIESSGDAEITILNGSGQFILKRQLRKGRNEISMAGCRKGTYFIKRSDHGEYYTFEKLN